MEIIKLVVVDDHPLMRDALCAAIEDEEDMLLLAECSNGVEAVQAARRFKPDVMLMDMIMPEKDGVTAISEILTHHRNIRIIALSSSESEQQITAAIEAGALSYLSKNTQRAELLTAIRTVFKGQAYLPPEIATKLMTSLHQKNLSFETFPIKNDPLTRREKQILENVGKGYSNKQIADILYLSEGTIRTHVHNILQKLNLENRNQLILYVVEKNKAETA